MTWLYAKLAGMGGKLLGILGALGGVVLIWMRGSYQKKRADQAERNITAMKAQIDQRMKAEDAARIAGVEGQERVNGTVEANNRGDYSSLND